MSDLHGHAICKDCGNGTLNNAVNEQFVMTSNDDVEDYEFAACARCGSKHIDGELYFNSDWTREYDEERDHESYQTEKR